MERPSLWIWLMVLFLFLFFHVIGRGSWVLGKKSAEVRRLPYRIGEHSDVRVTDPWGGSPCGTVFFLLGVPRVFSGPGSP